MPGFDTIDQSAYPHSTPPSGADHFRRWRAQREVVVGTPDTPPTDANPTEGMIIPIQGGKRIKIIVSQPTLTAEGALVEITNWSGRAWVRGGEPSLYGTDETLWARVNKADFPDRGSETFGEEFYVEGCSEFAFQIYALAGEVDASVFVTARVM